MKPSFFPSLNLVNKSSKSWSRLRLFFLLFLPYLSDLVRVLPHRYSGTYFTNPLSLMTALPSDEKFFLCFVSEN